MKILVSDAGGRLVFEEAAEPQAQSGQLMVRVMASSVNPRDLRMARSRAGYRAGSSFAGVVESAAGRSGPQAGARVAGVMTNGAWAERLAVAPTAIAPIPDVLDFAQAAGVASVGLTALYALERGGEMIGRRVLVTAANGAVGRLACQIARVAGAEVTAAVRSDAGAKALEGLGVQVFVGEDLGGAASLGPFEVILESVGGAWLTAAARLLGVGGTCVVLGSTAGGLSALDAAEFYQNTRTLVGFGLYPELNLKPASQGLRRLFGLIADGRVAAASPRCAPWGEINEALADPSGGKLVLDIG